MKPQLHILGRWLVVGLWSLWFGGFTFYASFVVPINARTLGGQREAGFITQQVTPILNIVGALAVAALLVQLVAAWRDLTRGERVGLAVTWALIFISQTLLFILHPIMTRMLDIPHHDVPDNVRFNHFHRAYLWASTLQWAMSMLQLWFLMKFWLRRAPLTAPAPK